MAVFLLLAVAVMAVMHIVYETLIAPAWRLNVKYKFFALRDQVYALKAEHPTQISDEVFAHLVDSINGAMSISRNVTFIELVRAKPLESEELNRQNARLLECPIDEVREIAKTHTKYVFRLILINSLGGAVTIIPLFIFVLFWTQLTEAIGKIAFGGQRRYQQGQMVAAP